MPTLFFPCEFLNQTQHTTYPARTPSFADWPGGNDCIHSIQGALRSGTPHDLSDAFLPPTVVGVPTSSTSNSPSWSQFFLFRTLNRPVLSPNLFFKSVCQWLEAEDVFAKVDESGALFGTEETFGGRSSSARPQGRRYLD